MRDGKTSLSQQLLEQADFVRIRTGIERKRTHGLATIARTGSGLASGVYAPDATRATYRRVLGMTRVVVAAGHYVVVKPLAPDEQRFVVTYATDGPPVAAATSNVGADVLARGGSSVLAPARDTPVPADPGPAAKHD